MSDNPLDTGEFHAISFMNPDITLRTGKQGPKWRFHADIEVDDALMFTRAMKLAGMILEYEGRAVVDDTPPKPKGGELSRAAAFLCQESGFDDWSLKQIDEFKYHRQANESPGQSLIYGACDITSRAELDHNKDAAAIFRKIREAFWKAQDAQNG